MRRQEPESVPKLQLSDRGNWIVTATSGDVFMLDLDAMMYYLLTLDEGHIFLDGGEPTLRMNAQPQPVLGIVGDEIRVGAVSQLQLGASERDSVVHATQPVTGIFASL